MSRSNKSWAPWLALAAAGALVYLAIEPIGRFAALDPFAAYRATEADRKPGRVAITLRDVELRMYEGATLVGEGKIGELAITRDRQRMMLGRIRNARFIREGETYAFTAPRAEYEFPRRVLHFAEQQGTLTRGGKEAFRFFTAGGRYDLLQGRIDAEGKTRVTGQDLDLQLGGFTYIPAERVLRVPGEVKGKYFGGDLSAQDFRYRVEPLGFETGAVAWSGPVQAEVPEAGRRQRWSIKAKSTRRAPGTDIEVWTEGEATDGEVIVRASRIERNVRTDVLVATGNVRYFGVDANLLCNKVTVYRQERRAVLEGNVQIFTKAEDQERLEVVELTPLRPVVPEEIARTRPAPPQSDEERRLDDEVRRTDNRRKYPATVMAERIEYWYARGSRRAVITGSPQARQELPGGRWRQIWASRAVYDAEAETLRLESAAGRLVRVRTSLGDDLKALVFVVSTRENDDAWEGEGVEGEVMPDEEELPARPGRGGGGGGTGGGTGGGLRGPIGR